MVPQKDSLTTQTAAIDLDALLAAVKNMDGQQLACIAAGMSYSGFVSLKTPYRSTFLSDPWFTDCVVQCKLTVVHEQSAAHARSGEQNPTRVS